MSFDDLAFHGSIDAAASAASSTSSSSNEVDKMCPECEEVKKVTRDVKHCHVCGATLLNMDGATAEPTNPMNNMLSNLLQMTMQQGIEQNAAFHETLRRERERERNRNQSNPNNTTNNSSPPADSAEGEALLPSLDSLQSFIPFLNSTYMQMVQAQQGVDIDQLISTMLSESSLKSPPTSKKFLNSLQEKPLTPKDFIQIVLRLSGVDRDFFPTLADFGDKTFYERHKKDGGVSQEHFSTGLVLANPFDGKGLKNAKDIVGKAVLLERGKITFVEKCRAVQQCVARYAIVVQTDPQLWPYTMSDSTGSGKDILIPCLMISKGDGDSFVAWTQGKPLVEKKTEEKASSEEKKEDTSSVQSDATSTPTSSTSSSTEPKVIKCITRERTLACPICREDYSVGMNTVKLPCSHHYCKECIVPWLEKRNNCPLCRFEFPTETEGPKHVDPPGPDSNNAQLRRDMFT